MCCCLSALLPTWRSSAFFASDNLLILCFVHQRVASRQTLHAEDVGVMHLRFRPARGRGSRELLQNRLLRALWRSALHTCNVCNGNEERRHPPFLLFPACIRTCFGVPAPRALIILVGPLMICAAQNPAPDVVQGSPFDPPLANRRVEGVVVVIFVRARGSGGPALACRARACKSSSLQKLRRSERRQHEEKHDGNDDGREIRRAMAHVS